MRNTETRTADLVMVPVANRRGSILNGVVVVGWKEEGAHAFAPLYRDLLTEEEQMTRCDVIT